MKSPVACRRPPRRSLRKAKQGARAERWSPRPRHLRLELLEDRRVLSLQPFPVPLQPVDPLGSLIYRGSVNDQIAVPGETDAFTIDLDDDQTVTVVVDPEATLQPAVEIRDPSGRWFGTATARAPGEDAVLQTFPTLGPGTYTATVGGAEGTSGAYTVELILNAALEEEGHGGPVNGDPTSAEDLDPSFIDLAGGLAQRGAVVGELPSPHGVEVERDDFESGILDSQWTTYSSGPTGRVYATDSSGRLVLVREYESGDGENLNEAIWTVDLSGVYHPTLSFRCQPFTDYWNRFSGDFVGHVNADGVAISDDGVHWHPVWTPEQPWLDGWNQRTVDLAAEALEAGMTLGPDFRIKFQQYDNRSFDDVFSYGYRYDYVMITTPVLPLDDWYRFTLADGETATVALTKTATPVMPVPPEVTLELYDESQNPLAAGVPAGNVDQVIDGFVDATADGGRDAYFVRVTGIGHEYSLVVTRGADFNLGPEGGLLSDAQDITLTGTVLGMLEPGPGPPVTFAVFGDYGSGNQNEENVANMVKSWSPDLIITTGDNNYVSLDPDGGGWTSTVGQYYGHFIQARSDNRYPEQTSPVQRFFPSVGNHDSQDEGPYSAGDGGDITGYLEYFHKDPVGGRLPPGVHDSENSYYDFQWGPIHFFAVDSDHAVVDESSRTAQMAWLQQGLADSMATWKFVYFHHPSFSSGLHGGQPLMQWPFQQWGADAVFCGHDHDYERIVLDGMPYFISGVGGGAIYFFRDPVPGSAVRYVGGHGSMRVTVDNDLATFEFLSIDDGAAGGNGGERIDTFTIDKSLPVPESVGYEHYRVDVNAEEVLTVRTFTPADGPGEFVNNLDPVLELYDPGEDLVATDDNGGPDGHNALLTHAATVAGTYTVRLLSAGGTAGQYVLHIGRHGGGQPAFEVTAAEPADGSWLPQIPAQMTLDFNDSVLLTTLSASDLEVDGLAATGVTVIDGDTVAFDLPPLADGAHTATIAAGAVTDLRGTPIEAFSSTFSVDSTPPRVIESSLVEGGILPVGTLVYTARFDEQLETRTLDAADVELVGVLSGAQQPTVFEYTPNDSTLTLEFAGLMDDAYTLRFLSGDGHFEDLIGHDLDGEPDPAATVPSGDGIDGGDFVVHFEADAGLLPYPLPLWPKMPLGSLIYDPLAKGVIGNRGARPRLESEPSGGNGPDTDDYTIELDDGQTIAVVVYAYPTLQPAVELLDPGGVSRGDAVAGGVGQDAVVPVVPTTGAGTYTVKIGAASGWGAYAVQILLNADVEREAHFGPANDEPASAQDLDPTFITLGDGRVQRGAVLGLLPTEPGAVIHSEGFESGGLDDRWTVWSSEPEGRIQVTQAYGASSGWFALLMDCSSTPASGQSNLNEAIWTVDLSGAGNPRLSFFHSEWNDEETWFPFYRYHFTGHYMADGVAISDDGENWYRVWNATNEANGEWGRYTIDLAAAAEAAEMTLGPDFRIKFQQLGRYPLTSDGRAFDEILIFTPTSLQDDWYRFTLDDGETATCALSAPGPGKAKLDLFDADQNHLAAGVIADNVDQIINNFSDATSNGEPDTYYIRVTGDPRTYYSLLVTRNADFDTEPNDGPVSRPQDISPAGAVLGYIDMTVGHLSTEQQRLSMSDGGAADDTHFGTSLAICGDTAIVGALGPVVGDVILGPARIYQLDDGQWIGQQQLVPSDAGGRDHAAYSVSISGDTAIVGDPSDDGHALDSGAAYVFRFDGTQWVERQKLTASDAGEGKEFGWSVAVSGDTAIVGAREGGGTPGSGSAYIFHFDGNQWNEQEKLRPPYVDEGDFFGSSVSISGNTVIVGAYRDDGPVSGCGSAYVYRFDGSQWIRRQKLTASDAHADDQFGYCVSISGDTAIVGSPRDNARGPDSGSAYVFHFDGSQWLEHQKLIASDASSGDLFGYSVSISANYAIAGAPGDGSGSAHLYRFTGGRWIEQQRSKASGGESGDLFGCSVAIDGDRILVGARNEGPNDSGAAYAFSTSAVDEYVFSVLAGDELVIRTFTPGDRPRQFVNDLDPVIALYDSSGNPVAEDDNSAPDGRNAELTYTPGTTDTLTVRVWGGGGTWGEYALVIGRQMTTPVVLGRYVFYNHSAFDDETRGLGDDDAIAPDADQASDPALAKAALLAGQTATFRNYTSYEKGINGIMVDIAGLDGPPTPADFEFRFGNDNNPAAWQHAPSPIDFAVHRRAGALGYDRVTILWEDHAIENTWLQVRVKAENLGLAEDDVFYFGNAPGEAGDAADNAMVNTTDEILARGHLHGPRDPAAIDDPYDFNRDGLVNATDRIVARNNRTSPADALMLITTPSGGGGAAKLDAASAHDSVLEGVLQRESGRVWSGKLAWFWDFAQMGTRKRPSKKDWSLERGVDKLLASYPF